MGEIQVHTQEDLAATKREHVEWGAPGLSVQEFVAREAELGSCDFAQGGKRRRWVLAPIDDPTTEDGFFAACETYRRGCYLVGKDREPRRRQTCYSICSVFVRPQDRGQGYAGEMVRLLQTKLAKKGEQALPWKGARITGSPLPSSVDISGKSTSEPLSPPYGLDAVASFLYSDVGDFYEPAGWRVMEHEQLEMTLESGTIANVPSQGSTLGEGDLPSVATLDEVQLQKELSAPTDRSLRFCLSDPNAESWRWLVKRSKFFARLQEARGLRQDTKGGPVEPVEWGFQLPNVRGGRPPAFVVWMYDWSGASPSDWHLEVLRVRFSSIEELAVLLRSAFAAAQRHGMTRVVAWNLRADNLTDQLRALLDGAHLRLVSRDSSLPCLAIYGRPSGDSAGALSEVEGLEWRANEKGWWC